MFKAIWLSDLHYAHSGDVFGHDPTARLQAAIQHINQHHSDADLCIISGDMVNHGTLDGYRAQAQLLETLKMPYLPMVGNHDERHALRATLPLPADCMPDFIQYSVATGEGLIICLDTLKPGSIGGEFCAERLNWLRATLKKSGATPAFIFMHHPPMDLGLQMQDADKMDGRAAFLSLLAEFDNVKYLFMGHVHRPISGTVGGIPFATMRSVLFQAPAPRPAWNWDNFEPAQEAPNLGILTIADEDVILHYIQFCKYELGTDQN